MNPDINKLKLWQQAAELEQRLRRGAAESQGAADQILAQLLEEFGCNSGKEGRKLLQTREQEIADMTVQLDQMLTELQERYGERLGD